MGSAHASRFAASDAQTGWSQAPDGSGQLNTSHTIHTLRFGPPVPGMSGALDEFVRTIGEGQPTGSYKYFLKVRGCRRGTPPYAAA